MTSSRALLRQINCTRAESKIGFLWGHRSHRSVVGASNMTSRRRISDFIGLTGPSGTGKGRAGATLLALVCLPVLASSVWSKSTSSRVEDIRAALDESPRAAAAPESGLSSAPVTALANFTATLPAGHPPV